ncbi:Ada metal-binding domain-containing protein [Desulfobacter postgatei]|uniref:Uncharacterized protein n=1 Tax=Desulfobacter postgatei 2ac9 TaxID=879212 RepID=I5B1V1_9BACT|nr:Ada metal-binding domain-containing protein [Desulfobacter postgatei]EIM63464.1 hypothetical protein DespoDRAFT_01528 [Desulfobacter postgatei 2ac9]
MKKFIIGALLLLVGISGFSFNFFDFLTFAAGLVPILMIIGGSLAVYLGIEELKQSDNNDTETKIKSAHTQEDELNKESTGEPKSKTKPVPDTQSTKPAQEIEIKIEENHADKQQEQDEQAKEKTPPLPTASSQVTEPPAPEEAGPASASVQFKGNIETLVFHSVACNFANGKNCSMNFTTKEEAETQGYKPCKICMPDA